MLKVNQEHKAIVEAGGGIYVGPLETIVLFNSPATRSTLALKESALTPEAVRATIAASDERFGIRKAS